MKYPCNVNRVIIKGSINVYFWKKIFAAKLCVDLRISNPKTFWVQISPIAYMNYSNTYRKAWISQFLLQYLCICSELMTKLHWIWTKCEKGFRQTLQLSRIGAKILLSKHQNCAMCIKISLERLFYNFSVSNWGTNYLLRRAVHNFFGWLRK